MAARWRDMDALLSRPDVSFPILLRMSGSGGTFRGVREAGRRLAPQRDQSAQPDIAQVQAAPDQHAEEDREEDREPALLGAHVGRDRAAEIAGQQDRSQDGGARDDVEERRDEQDDSQAEDHARRIPELDHGLHHRRRLNELRAAVEQQEQHRQGAHGPSGPEHLVRDGSRLGARLHARVSSVGPRSLSAIGGGHHPWRMSSAVTAKAERLSQWRSWSRSAPRRISWRWSGLTAMPRASKTLRMDVASSSTLPSALPSLLAASFILRSSGLSVAASAWTTASSAAAASSRAATASGFAKQGSSIEEARPKGRQLPGPSADHSQTCWL